jgi:hypothetical protein
MGTFERKAVVEAMSRRTYIALRQRLVGERYRSRQHLVAWVNQSTITQTETATWGRAGSHAPVALDHTGLGLAGRIEAQMARCQCALTAMATHRGGGEGPTTRSNNLILKSAHTTFDRNTVVPLAAAALPCIPGSNCRCSRYWPGPGNGSSATVTLFTHKIKPQQNLRMSGCCFPPK